MAGKVHKGKSKMRKIRNIGKKGSAIDEGNGEVKMVKIIKVDTFQFGLEGNQ